MRATRRTRMARTAVKPGTLSRGMEAREMNTMRKSKTFQPSSQKGTHQRLNRFTPSSTCPDPEPVSPR
eukprot:186307-Rhodomonas_salina.1